MGWLSRNLCQRLPLENPPIAIAKQGRKAILNYWKQLEKQGTTQLYEAKLMIVGEPGAGKTSLMKKLVEPEYSVPKEGDPNLESTVGINIHEGWTFPYTKDTTIDFKANLWDFGGAGSTVYDPSVFYDFPLFVCIGGG